MLFNWLYINHYTTYLSGGHSFTSITKEVVMQREILLKELSRDHKKVWDVVVIGGGATGLGVAVDAASRGILLRVHPAAAQNLCTAVYAIWRKAIFP